MNSIHFQDTTSEKVSAVFLRFAKPWLDLACYAHDEVSDERLNETMRIPWLIWNSYTVDVEGNSKVDCRTSLKVVINQAPEPIKELINNMAKERETTFKKYDYAIGDFKISTGPNTHEKKLRAESRQLQKTRMPTP